MKTSLVGVAVGGAACLLIACTPIAAAPTVSQSATPSSTSIERHLSKQTITEATSTESSVMVKTTETKGGSAPSEKASSTKKTSPAPGTQPGIPAKTPTSTCEWHAQYASVVNRYPHVRWAVADHGSMGVTYSQNSNVYIAPRTPCTWVKSIMLHEYIHVQMLKVYKGEDWPTILSEFGGYEKVADCGARQLGATVLTYTSKCTDKMNLAGAAMIKGVRAPNT